MPHISPARGASLSRWTVRNWPKGYCPLWRPSAESPVTKLHYSTWNPRRMTVRALSPLCPKEHRPCRVGTTNRDVVAYLESIPANLEETGLSVNAKVRAGNPGDQIVEEARDGGFDLVVMSSHGRTGYVESAFGSAVDRVVRASPVPVLLLRADGAHSAPRHLQGPMVFRCEECGRRTLRESVNELDRFSRCHRHLKTCANCVFFDGADCAIHHLEGNAYPEVGCEQFEYRETPEVLR